MKHLLVRLVVSLGGVLGLWVLVWMPLAVSEGKAEDSFDMVMGDANAPVTMIEYASLTCPHCATFHKDVLPDLKERYIATGKVKLVFRDFPLDQYALQASVLAHCAGPDRYFAFLDMLFADQSRWAQASDPTEALRQLARLGGLKAEQIDACLADKSLEDRVLQTRLDAEAEHEIRSTPSFVINGTLYAGNRDIDGFSSLIDDLL